jgi:hypothetical protein
MRQYCFCTLPSFMHGEPKESRETVSVLERGMPAASLARQLNPPVRNMR